MLLEKILHSPPSSINTTTTPNYLEGHPRRTMEGVRPLWLVHLVADLHVVRIVHYVLDHVLQDRVPRKHRVHLRAIVLDLKLKKFISHSSIIPLQLMRLSFKKIPHFTLIVHFSTPHTHCSVPCFLRAFFFFSLYFIIFFLARGSLSRLWATQ